MIKTITIRECDSALNDGYTVLAIVRNPGKFGDYIAKTDGVHWIPTLSPSQNLMRRVDFLKKSGEWNQDKFASFALEFVKEIAKSEKAKEMLNRIYKASENGWKIALACFCGDEDMCHRSIVAGLLQGVGCEYEGADYSAYFLPYLLETKK